MGLHDACLQLDTIEQAARGNERIETLRKLQNPELNRMLELALTPFVRFFVTAETMPAPTGSLGTVSFADFENLCEQLSTRALSGNAAKEAIAGFLGRCRDVEAKWVARVLAKDLRLDMAASAVNKAVPGLVFQESLALAEKLIDVDEEGLKGRWAVQVKHDGVRCKATLPADGGEVMLTSREGLPLDNYEPVREAFTAMNRAEPCPVTRYLDCEVVSIVDGKVDFQAAQSVIHAKKSKKSVGLLRAMVFDGAVENEWISPTMTYGQRHESIYDFVDDRNQHVELVKHDEILVDPTIPQLMALLQKYLDAGHEGFMLRKLDEPVVMDRSFRLIKVKKEEDAEFEVVGTYPGKGKRKQYIGGLVVKLENGSLQNVGSGAKDKDLEAWTKEPPIGRMVTIRFMERTKDGALRQPRIKGFRALEDLPS